MRRFFSCVSLLLAPTLSGCLPVPNDQQVLPALQGRVLANGLPVAGADIHVVAKASGEEMTGRAATTDADGRFSHPGMTVKRRVLWVLGDPIYDWTLRIHHADTWHSGYSDGRVGHPSRRVELACDLKRIIDNKVCVLLPAAPAKP